MVAIGSEAEPTSEPGAVDVSRLGRILRRDERRGGRSDGFGGDVVGAGGLLAGCAVG